MRKGLRSKESRLKSLQQRLLSKLLRKLPNKQLRKLKKLQRMRRKPPKMLSLKLRKPIK